MRTSVLAGNAATIDDMDLKLYDTKSASQQPLVPIREGHVGIYLCGPTVQGSPHIGHLRAAVAFDILIRWLKRHQMEVTYVRNVTDIDDKILRKAKDTGEEWWAVAQHYEREFQDAYATLGLLRPTIEPRATGHITDQLEMIERLIERGHAYPDGNGNVYFDVSSQWDYGSLTRQNLGDMKPASGEQTMVGKRDPKDFALWKAAKPGEPRTASWRSPWGVGRPGWHLECSAMAHRYLGEAFDIHGGGIDLRFPHHENEQAQSYAAGYDFANLWIHNAWVTIAGEKMAKSIGNTLDLGSLLKVCEPETIRFALSSVHHRSTIEWGPKTLEVAGKGWNKLSSFVFDATDIVGDLHVKPDSLTPDELPQQFTNAMNSDLNVAAALAVIHHHVKLGRQALSELRKGRGDVAAGSRTGGSGPNGVSTGSVASNEKGRAVECEEVKQVTAQLLLVRSMLDVLGLDPFSNQWGGACRTFGGVSGSEGSSEIHRLQAALDKMVQNVLDERQKARMCCDWVAADALRNQLSQLGIKIEDGPEGAVWVLSPNE